MSTVRDDMLEVFAELRHDLIDVDVGLRQDAMYLRTESPSDGRGGAGAVWTTVDTLVVERPRIRKATGRDIVTGAGMIAAGDLMADRITPQNAAGTVGTLVGPFRPATPAGGHAFVVIVGDGYPPYVTGGPRGPTGGGLFTVVWSDTTPNFGMKLALHPATGRATP